MSPAFETADASKAIEKLGAGAEEIDWYHTQELAPGLVTPGMFDLRPHVGRYGLPPSMTGLRVLDVGTFEGFWAFEMERRGAAVTGLDIDDVQDLDWPPRLRPKEGGKRGEGFAMARTALGSSVERVAMPIYEATPERLGAFDLIFCGSVMIHLRDPNLALERLAALAAPGGRLIFADEYSPKLDRLRFLGIGGAAEFLGESPWMTWWRPASRTWATMISCAGWEDVAIHGRFNMDFRTAKGGVPHVVVHAAAPPR
jgi:tRNA (mo5U34)-methyltransferase